MPEITPTELLAEDSPEPAASHYALPPSSDIRRGSLWRKWDLHVHTPASYHWNDGMKFQQMTSTQKEAALRRIIDKINCSDVAVFGVMDYWTFDGYLEIRRFAEANPGLLEKCVLPGIELRLECSTDCRLNTHVLFHDALSPEDLSRFLHTLRCGGAVNKSPTREVLIEVGRSYAPDKLAALGCVPADRTDEEKMLVAGQKSALITRQSLRDAMEQVGKENCLMIQPYDTNDGLDELDWKAHPYEDQELMRWADIFEAKHPGHVSLCLGLGHPTKPEVQSAFLHNMGGCPKPAFRGSDAHKVDDYGKYPNDRIAWLKADPTFLGLKQVCKEPAERCWVGLRPPKLVEVDKNPTKYIRRISVTRLPEADPNDRWFDAVDVELNPGLIAIIGNKGSGKSALADIIALLGNTRASEFEFLNAQRFRKGKSRAQFFSAKLTWEDGKSSPVSLDLDPDPQHPERVRYLPQRAIEDLCNELASDGPSSFEGELKKVIFSHVPLEQQMGKESLDQLLVFKTGPSKESVRQLQGSLSGLNARIVELENEISANSVTAYRNSVALKIAELEAHAQKEPNPPVGPAPQETKDDAQIVLKLAELKQGLDALLAEREVLKAERILLSTKHGNLENLTGSLGNLNAVVQQFREDLTPKLAEVGLALEDVLTFKVEPAPINRLLTVTKDRITAINLLLDGNENIDGIEDRIAACEFNIPALQAKLDAPQKAHQEYLEVKKKWELQRDAIIGAADRPETKTFFEAKLKAATDVVPGELEKLKATRRTLVGTIHFHLMSQRAEYEKLYAPVQKIATESPLTKKALKLDFAVFLSPTVFEDQFINLINRQRRGPFQGEIEGAKSLHQLVTECDFSSSDRVVDFIDGIITAMRASAGTAANDKAALSSQLRKEVKVVEFYDALYSLRFLEPRYTLRLEGKEISELSPGEKGALLLVFYLLLDQEEIPIIIDQPEQNLDNESVVSLLVDCIRRARERRQVILVTHNPNLAIVCDADQIITSKIDKASGNLITYASGSIENPQINNRGVDILEGTFPAFDNRRQKWMKPPVR